ncbi:MAG: hypothetical protein Q8Q39_00920 [bacterium]|nr:hypothetical protein [bacterium]
MQTPIRADMGDNMHYLARFKRLQVEGQIGESMFTWEHRGGRSYYAFFENSVKRIPGFDRISPLWLYVILKVISATAATMGFYGLLRACRIGTALALGIATAVVMLYGAYLMTDPGIATWFFGIFALGFAAMAPAIVRDLASASGLFRSVVFLVMASMHPVYYAASLGIGGAWWLMQVATRQTFRVGSYAALWVFAAVAIGIASYGKFFSVVQNISSPALPDFLARMSALRIHVPQTPFLALRFALVAFAAYVFWRYAKNHGQLYASRWLLPFFVGIAGMAGVLQNAVTGISWLGDHFQFIEEFAVIPFAALIWLHTSDTFWQTWRSPRRVALGVTLLVITVIFGLSVAYPRPWRSWLVLGRWVPVIGGYALIGWYLMRGSLAGIVPRASRLVLALLVAGSVCYASLFTWRIYAHTESGHFAAQAYRPLFEALSGLPYGVVMAPPGLAEFITLYTPHRVYWSRYNGQFAGTHEELSGRWLDESAVFADNRSLISADPGMFSMFGAINVWCDTLTEKIFYTSLRNAGITDATLCNGEARDREWARLLAEREARVVALDTGADWNPQYKLEYLVVENGTDGVNPALESYFSRIVDAGEFTIYRYQNQ